jgi:hypothetical protein
MPTITSCNDSYDYLAHLSAIRTVSLFYEPFNESLANCTARKVERDSPSSWNSRHPALSRPYRHEYLPLPGLFGKGVRGYREDFAVARFFPPYSSIVPEVRYLSRLLEHARRLNKQAVLGFSRSLARTALIKQALGGYHVVIHRIPFNSGCPVALTGSPRARHSVARRSSLIEVLARV